MNYQEMTSEALLKIMSNIKQELLSRKPTPTKVLYNGLRISMYISPRFELSDKVCERYKQLSGRELSPYTTVRDDPLLVKIVEDMKSNVHTENSSIQIKTIDLHPGERPYFTKQSLGEKKISIIFDNF